MGLKNFHAAAINFLVKRSHAVFTLTELYACCSNIVFLLNVYNISKCPVTA